MNKQPSSSLEPIGKIVSDYSGEQEKRPDAIDVLGNAFRSTRAMLETGSEARKPGKGRGLGSLASSKSLEDLLTPEELAEYNTMIGKGRGMWGSLPSSDMPMLASPGGSRPSKEALSLPTSSANIQFNLDAVKSALIKGSKQGAAGPPSAGGAMSPGGIMELNMPSPYSGSMSTGPPNRHSMSGLATWPEDMDGLGPARPHGDPSLRMGRRTSAMAPLGPYRASSDGRDSLGGGLLSSDGGLGNYPLTRKISQSEASISTLASPLSGSSASTLASASSNAPTSTTSLPAVANAVNAANNSNGGSRPSRTHHVIPRRVSSGLLVPGGASGTTAASSSTTGAATTATPTLPAIPSTPPRHTLDAIQTSMDSAFARFLRLTNKGKTGAKQPQPQPPPTANSGGSGSGSVKLLGSPVPPAAASPNGSGSGPGLLTKRSSGGQVHLKAR